MYVSINLNFITMKKIQLITVIALPLFLQSFVVQAQEDCNEITSFSNCINYSDTCKHIGNVLINCLEEQRFEDLEYIFSDTIHFRALIPSKLVTLNNSTEAMHTVKKWFGVGDADEFKILDSSCDVLVDCLHIGYKIFLTYRGSAYKVEQHVFCEVSSGKIQKLSLVCSGFRKLEKAPLT